MKSHNDNTSDAPGFRLVPGGANPFAMVERCMASWLDERLRMVLDEKFRQWISKAAPPVAPPVSEQPEYLSREGAARLTGYSVKTITRWIRTGRLRPYGLRGERVRRSEIGQLMSTLSESRQGTGEDLVETEADVARRILDGDHDPRRDE